MRMFPTRHDLPEKEREQLVTLLNRHLAASIDLQLQAKQAHWNVKGPHFHALHALFDQVHAAAEDAADALAERAAQLGGTAQGTLPHVARQSPLPEYPPAVDGRSHLEAIANALATVARGTREAILQATELGDQATADLLTEITRELDKQLWMVESHLQAER
jgi:starvation-inducible DNA-binding protein